MVGAAGARRVGALVSGTAALAALTCLAVPGSAAGADGDGDGGLDRPYGDVVQPGTSYVDTAEVGPGTYALDIPAEGEDHYFEIPRTDPDDVLWYGVTLQLEEAAGDRASLVVEGTADGDTTQECNTPYPDVAGLSFLTALFSADRAGACRSAESIVLRVANGTIGGAEDDEPLPTSASYQLVVWSEPPVDDVGALPGPNEQSPWVDPGEPDRAGGEVTGARTFTDATPLADGVHATTIVKDRPSIFAFPLTYGQHAQVLATSLGTADSAETVGAVWVSPLGGRLRTVQPSGGPGPELALESGAVAGWSTPVVTWTNRLRAGGVGSSPGGLGFARDLAAPAAFAGTYYLVLELPQGIFEELPDEVPVTLQVRTVTDYEGTPPGYVAAPAPLQSLDGSGYVATQEERAAQEAARREDPAPWSLVGGLFAGAALLAAVGGVATGRVLRGRASSRGAR